MKRFLILVMTLLTVNWQAWASRCGGFDCGETPYLFSPFDSDSDLFGGPYHDFWKAYVGNNAEFYPYHVENLKWVDDIETSDNPIVATARNKNDKEMLDYLSDLVAYLKNNRDHYNEWDYPTEEEIVDINNCYETLMRRAKAYKGTRLKDRYMLMAMRCMFQLNQLDACMAYWEKSGSKAADAACRNTMKGLYAGALYKKNRQDEAALIYMELGDRQSLKCCLNDERDYAGIEKIYKKDNNSPLLNFLIEDFVNMYQENTDGDCSVWDYFSIPNNEAKQFVELAQKVISGKKTNNPLMWAEAAALVSSYMGDNATAEKLLAQCDKMDGSQRLKDNLRLIKFYQFINTKSYKEKPDYVVQEFKWLKDKDNVPFFNDARNRIYQLLNDRLEGDFCTQYLMYPGEYKLYEAPTDKVLALRNFLKNSKKFDAFQKYCVASHDCNVQDAAFDDVLGTNCIAAMDFDKAIEYLQKVQPSYYNKMCLSNYFNNRDYTIPAWDKVQDAVEDSPTQASRNLRLDYCKDMKALLAKYNAAKGDEKCALAYKLAVMYHAASQWGPCWFMGKYFWSTYYSKDDAVNNAYEAKTREYLEIAAKSGDKDIKYSAIYARTWMAWHDYNYYDYYMRPDEISPEMKSSMEALCQYWDGIYGKGQWTMSCDCVMDYARSR